MFLTRYALSNRLVMWVLTVIILVGGYLSFQNLSRLEDPEFTIKDALVITPYPGAGAEEVEEEVSDAIELAVQQLGQLKEIESRSIRGLSTVQVTIQDKYDKNGLPQVWDELRRKVSDAQSDLPPGTGESVVIDDFGDVFGIFFVLYGDEYTAAELKNYAEDLQKELVLEQDVAKVTIFAPRTEAIYVEPNRDQLASLGIPIKDIVDVLQKKNLVADAGHVNVGPEFIAVQPTGAVSSVADFGDILIGGDRAGTQIYLRDIATITRGYVEPASEFVRYDGHNAVGVGISTVSGGNVVVMGEAVERRIRELTIDRPLGMEIGIISYQAQAVTEAVDGFAVNLAEAVIIVVVVLLFFMGVRSGLLIGFVLTLTIAATMILMANQGIALERISLGALVIALGMLVDNAIVVTDGILVGMQRGKTGEEASLEVVEQTAWPLAGATVIAILAFASIGTSQDSTGEFCRSLFQVVGISLSLSWVFAVTVTPLLAITFLKPEPIAPGEDPYDTKFFRAYRNLVDWCMRRKFLTSGLVVAVFAASLYGFGFVKNSFFPDSSRPQFMLDVWLPEGTSIDSTVDMAAVLEKEILETEGVTHVSSIIGTGAPRFMLTYDPEKTNSAYMQFLVDVEDYEFVDPARESLEDEIGSNFAEALVYSRRFALGPGGGAKVEARFLGRDPDVLRDLTAQAMRIMEDDPVAKGVRSDWRNRAKRIVPVVSEEAANLQGITRQEIADAIRGGFEGLKVGVYREADHLLPIMIRAPEDERAVSSNLQNLQIWSRAAQRMVPIRQVVSGFETTWEDPIIIRRDRVRAVTVGADPKIGEASTMFARLRPQIEDIELPPGYTLEWGGEYENSQDAMAALVGSIPLFVLLMVLIVITLFNALRQPLVIWMTVPLALIGVTWGLLLTGLPFGFMAILGFLSLSGMLIKNAIVLIDQIEVERSGGAGPWEAVLSSGVSRLRPVAMAAATTALGMIPLLFDPFFASMAITIIGGLVVATVLTMVVVPVFYALVYGLKKPA